MNRSSANPAMLPTVLGLADARLYLASSALVLGNVLLPYALHSIPDGGRMFLPLFFFTLVAGWRFGARAALLTGVLSPLASHFLSGMPPAAALQGLMLQSILLGLLAAFAASRGAQSALALLAGLVVVVLAHQALILAPRAVLAGLPAAVAAFRFHLPGILLQILGGFAVLRALAPRPSLEA